MAISTPAKSTLATPTQVATAVGGAVNKQGQIIGAGGQNLGAANPKDLPGYKPGTSVNDKLDTQPTPENANATPVTGAVQNNNPQLLSTDQAPQDLVNQVGQAQTLADQLKAKYTQAHADLTKSGVEAPPNQGSASAGVKTALDSQPKATPEPETPASVNSFFNPEANPALQESTQQLLEFLHPDSERQTLTESMTQLKTDRGELAGLKTELMNVKNIMSGSQQDIMDEVTKAGGTISASLLANMTIARNRSLLVQQSKLEDQIATQKDLIANDTSLVSDEKQMASQQATERLGLLKYQQDNYQNQQSAARDTIKALLGTNMENAPVVYNAVKGTAFEDRYEQILGIPKGGLKKLAGTQTSGNSQDAQNWANTVLSGNATMAQVPANLKNAVNRVLNDPATGAKYSPLAGQRFATESNRITKNFIDLPQYQLTANGLPYLQRIKAASEVPGSISDQDLLDSLTKLNTAGNAITDAQVKLVTEGKSFADAVNIWQNKFKNGGVLSTNQREQIQKIANKIYDNYKTGYQPVYDQATQQLKDAGVPEAFWTIPDLNKLNKGISATDKESPKLLQPQEIPTGYYQANDGLLYKQ